MISRARIARFAQKPLSGKWAAVEAKLREAGWRLAAALRRAWYATLSERSVRRQIFRRVYRNGLWGRGGQSELFSGIGSRGEAADAYVDCMVGLLRRHAIELGRPLTVVDLGCGDFYVGRALTTKLPDFTYIGCDIVPELIAHHLKTHATDRIRFQQLDLVSDPLPGGDVCLVRQVLQHLSNAEIKRFIRRADYEYLYVTEGQPTIRTGPFNPDMAAGAAVRFDWRRGIGRGVELDKPPYCLTTWEVLRVAAHPYEIIITERVLYKQSLDFPNNRLETPRFGDSDRRECG
jgi:hypothetical protein